MYQQHWTASLTPLMAVGVALLLGAGLIWASGASVLEAYGGLFAGMCGSWPALSETGVAATPYILTGLAVALGSPVVEAPRCLRAGPSSWSGPSSSVTPPRQRGPWPINAGR